MGGAAEALAVVNGRDERAVVHAAIEEQATEVMEQLRKLLRVPPERRARAEVVAALELGRKSITDLRLYEEALQADFERPRWALEAILRQMRSILDEDAAVPGAALLAAHGGRRCASPHACCAGASIGRRGTPAEGVVRVD